MVVPANPPQFLDLHSRASVAAIPLPLRGSFEVISGLLSPCRREAETSLNCGRAEKNSGGRSKDRTCDFSLVRAALSQLSYPPDRPRSATNRTRRLTLAPAMNPAT